MYSCFELRWSSKYIMTLIHWQLTIFIVFKVQKQVLFSLNPEPKQNHKYHPTCITFDACTVSWETYSSSTESSVFIYLLFSRVRSKVVNFMLFWLEHPEYTVSILHPIQEIPLKRTCKYFRVFRTFWGVSGMSKFFFFF